MYAPTAAPDDAEAEEFYNLLGDTINLEKTKKPDRLIVMGDLNSQIGQHTEMDRPWNSRVLQFWVKEWEGLAPYWFLPRNKQFKKPRLQ